MTQDASQQPVNISTPGVKSTPQIAAEMWLGYSFTDYAAILKELGADPIPHGTWAVVSDSGMVQGWKIHLSSIRTEAVELLHRVVPLFLRKGVSFKAAKNEAVLAQLNEGALGSTQIGKFITIYPTSDEHSRQLAEELIQLTQGFSGPVVVSDLRLGDIVYARYGGFNPIVKRDRLGQISLSIYAPDGSALPDSYCVPFVPPQGVTNPFADFDVCLSDPPAANQIPQNGSKLFGPGFLVLEIIKHDPKGSVFRGIDLRNQQQVAIKIIKQGRQYCLSDEHGRDMRTRLQRQEQLHLTLCDRVPIPHVDSYFEVNGDGYLPLEYIEGQSIEAMAVNSLKNGSWSSLSADEQIRLLSLFEQVVCAVEAMHNLGYVHRDLTASNIWIGADEHAYLLDLELTHAVGDPTPAFGLGTPGFMSPQQESRRPPAFSDDIYALSCSLMLLLTGTDPRRLLFVNERHRKRQWQELTPGVPPTLLAVAVRGLRPKPSLRPNLETFKRVVSECIRSLNGVKVKTNGSKRKPRTGEDRKKNLFYDQLAHSISGGQRGLLEDALSDEASGLWLSPPFSNSAHGANGRSPGTGYEIRRSANRGVAGAVYLLGRLGRFGYATEAARERVQKVIKWLCADEPTPDEGMPGLHFGEAGVAVSILEAAAGGLIDLDSSLESYVVESFSGSLDWPDITHGAAGQGLAALYCVDRLENRSLHDFVHQCAAYLIRTQADDGSWAMPPGVEGMTGETLSGFAHGVSGIVYFLAEYARRYGSLDADKAWQAGAGWLVGQAISVQDGQALEWAYSNIHDERWKWWCHGSPGIALTFLRLYEQTKDVTYSELATKALRAHSVDLRYPNLSQCHGLSGLGEIYLEAGRVLEDSHWYERARSIANTLIHLRHETKHGSMTWLVEDLSFATADLMGGSSGVIHFLLRLSLNSPAIGFPLLLDPIMT